MGTLKGLVKAFSAPLDIAINTIESASLSDGIAKTMVEIEEHFED